MTRKLELNKLGVVPMSELEMVDQIGGGAGAAKLLPVFGALWGAIEVVTKAFDLGWEFGKGLSNGFDGGVDGNRSTKD